MIEVKFKELNNAALLIFRNVDVIAFSLMDTARSL